MTDVERSFSLTENEWETLHFTITPGLVGTLPNDYNTYESE